MQSTSEEETVHVFLTKIVPGVSNPFLWNDAELQKCLKELGVEESLQALCFFLF